VATFLTRKLGKEAYERLAGPLFGGLYASDPADMVVGISAASMLRDLGIRRSLLAALLARRGVSPAGPCSFRQGMQSLTDALHVSRAGSVRLASAARRLVRAGSGWRVEAETEDVEAGTVVLACAAPAAARLLAELEPDAARRIASLVYNPLAVVHLDAGATGLGGLGYQVAFGEGLATRGVTWNDSLFGGEGLGRSGVYTAFLGGAQMASVVAEPDDRIGDLAAREFERVSGHPAGILGVSRTSIPAWDDSWQALAGLALPPGIRAAASWRSRPAMAGRLLEASRLAEELSTSRRH
jgi:oxygen-dependent protoporphyrinogen oxidase